jgi:small-conductance mechanosensitive channel
MYQWNTNPESILVGGGVAAIIVGIGVSTIIGNMLSAALMLTAFPAKIGDSIHIVNDNIGGKVVEINFIFTKIITNEGAEYVVPNNAIVQGNVTITKGLPLYGSQLRFAEGDNIEVRDSSTRYCAMRLGHKACPIYSSGSPTDSWSTVNYFLAFAVRFTHYSLR